MMFSAYGLSFAAASPGNNDEFSSSSLNGFWTKVGTPSATYDLTTSPGYIAITSPANNDLGGTTNSAPRIMQTVTGDFAVVTRVLGTYTAAGVHAGILVYIDDTHFMRVEVRNTNAFQIGGKNGPTFVSSSVAGSVPIAPVYLKMEKIGTSITGYWSSDGTTWTQFGPTYTLTGADGTVQIGLFVINQNTGVPSFTASFDFFHITPINLFVLPEYPLGTLAIPLAIGAAFLIIKRNSLPRLRK